MILFHPIFPAAINIKNGTGDRISVQLCASAGGYGQNIDTLDYGSCTDPVEIKDNLGHTFDVADKTTHTGTLIVRYRDKQTTLIDPVPDKTLLVKLAIDGNPVIEYETAFQRQFGEPEPEDIL
jgi:hypothetical protein